MTPRPHNGKEEAFMKLVYPAIFTPEEDAGGYCVTFPDLPGCVTEGNTLSEALEMAVDAASGWVLDELEDGRPAPAASGREAVRTEEDGAFVNLVVLDMDSYAEKYGQKAVRKNCTIPAWLNTLAEKSRVSFSDALVEGLSRQLHLDQP